jgi:hypothetical protein
MTTDLRKYKEAKAAVAAKVAEAETKVREAEDYLKYWNDVKAEEQRISGLGIFEDKKASEAMEHARADLRGDRESLEILNDTQPRGLEEIGARLLARGL